MVRVALSLAGLLCAALTVSACKLATVEGSEVTSGAVASALAGLFVGREVRGGVGEGGQVENSEEKKFET